MFAGISVGLRDDVISDADRCVDNSFECSDTTQNTGLGCDANQILTASIYIFSG